MKKRRYRILLNIATLCLCLAAIAVGVYSVKTAQLNITGTIGFQAHNCDVYVNGTLTGASTLSGTTLTPTTLHYYDKTNNNTDTTKYVNVHNDTTGWAIGDVYFDDMNNVPEGKLAQDIVITLKIYNNSKFLVYATFDASTLGIDTSQIKAKAQKGTDTAKDVLCVEMPANQTSTDAITLTITFTLESEDFAKLTLTSEKPLLKFTKDRPTIKGDLITMDLGGDYATGLQNTYRVLKTEGNTALVIAMFEANTSQVYWTTNSTTKDANGEIVTKYEGSDLDIYLNTTWYGTLNSTAKSAIVASNITQYSYMYNNNPASYADYSSKSTVEIITGKYVYALDIEDIEEYFGGTAGGADKNTAGKFSSTEIYTLFWNTTEKPETVTHPWLRSGIANDSNLAWYIDSDDGILSFSNVGYTYNFFVARPAFKIDLSKISYTFA